MTCVGGHKYSLLKKFQSTSPVWGMTNRHGVRRAGDLISIHIPRVGDDEIPESLVSFGKQFQSTSPVWGMTRVVERDALR